MIVLKSVIRCENDQNTVEATWVERVQLPDWIAPATPAMYDEAGNLVVEAVAEHTVQGEVLETQVRCHYYSSGQMAELRADLGADAGAYEALIAEVEATHVPPSPETDEQRAARIVAQIEAMEREKMLPRIVREMTIAQLESWAVQHGYPLDQFRVANKGYRLLKEFDEQIAALRALI